MNNQLSKKAILFCCENKKLLFIFIMANVIMNLGIMFPLISLNTKTNISSVLSANFDRMITVLIFMSIMPFIDAGLFGLAFLKLKNKKTGVGVFFHIAKCNFWGFLRVSIVLGLIFGLFGLILLSVLSFVYSFIHLQLNILSFGSTIFASIFNLFFVLAFPLVIIGYFSGQNLKPITSSIAKVFNHFAMFKFVIVLLLAQCIIGLLSILLIPQAFAYYNTIALPILTTPLRFLVLIYSYLLITEVFIKDLQFDFDK